MRRDQRLFDVKHEASRSYPEESDQGYTRGADIDETRYITFSVHKKYLEEIREEITRDFEGSEPPLLFYVLDEDT